MAGEPAAEHLAVVGPFVAGVGGVVGPTLFGALIETGSRGHVFAGYLIGAILMIMAGAIALRWAVAAERKPLETVARPLAAGE